MKDMALVLRGMYDASEYLGSGQKIVKWPAKCASVLVWNGPTNEFYPAYVLVDLLTMMGHPDKPPSRVTFACQRGPPKWEWIFVRLPQSVI